METLFGKRQHSTYVLESIFSNEDDDEFIVEEDKENEEEPETLQKLKAVRTPMNKAMNKAPSNSGSTTSKKRDFSTSFMDAKENEIQFNKEWF
jgi:hypothetical protein